ncbi:MAG TPA: cytochrome b/b6 domain-containing protein [Sphingomonas sp.]|jgi:thiosulfate reductase cytochrome b subunit|uniref:cytochrome b/b6 domain-containing protein n=1 Tax=Sphingomonas sp. TaxID=28214 RepID=UPI002ED874FB
MATTASAAASDDRPLVKRHRGVVRIWHWINAVTVFVMLMSGLMIFNAHPRLYWGHYGANPDVAWLEIGSTGDAGFVRVGPVHVPTTGVLGYWHDKNGALQRRAFPGWATIPGGYSLSAARRWHLFFAWLLVVPGVLFWLWSLTRGHVRDLTPTRAELTPAHVWADVKNHARLRFPAGQAALKYNILQKLSYFGVVFGLLPLLVLTGLGMSPGMVAAWPWLLDLFGGRQSARSLHFIAMALLAGFILVHLTMVLLAGPYNEVRSMVTGRFRLPPERADAKQEELA